LEADRYGDAEVILPTQVRVKRKRSPRGNWLVVEMHQGQIFWCTWVQTWAGVQASKRNKEKYLELYQELENRRAAKSQHNQEARTVGRVFVLDIERMLDFAVTEGADQINDLYKLWEKE